MVNGRNSFYGLTVHPFVSLSPYSVKTAHEGQMTVGLYLNEPYPIMMSDCLALPHAGGMQLFNPSNIEFYDGANGKLATLKSKFVYADENTIITFAGNSKNIKKFVKKLPDWWEARDRNLRPMQFLHKLDYDIRAVHPGWRCSVLGASVLPNSGEDKRANVNNYASFNDHSKFDTNHFGICSAIGSGSDELRKFVENADKNIDRLGSMGDDFLSLLLGALNGHALFGQRKVEVEQTWGGLLQAQFYHIQERKWLRTPPWFHICVLFEGKDLVFKGLHPKTVYHNSIPDDLHASAVVTWVTKDDGNSETRVWPVHSAFISVEKREAIKLAQVFETPNLITITSIVEIEENLNINHSTYHVDYVKGISFENNDNPFAWNIALNDLVDWLRQEMLNDPSIPLLRN